MSVSIESDEVLARRLQEEELRQFHEYQHAQGRLDVEDDDLASAVAHLGGVRVGGPNAPGRPQGQDRQEEVRLNVIGTVSNMARILKFVIAYGFVECILTAIIIQHRSRVGGHCSMPLHVWCIVHSARWVISLPYFIRRLKGYEIRPFEENLMGWNRLFGLVWFLMAHAWIYNASECRSTDTAVYYYSIALLSMVYLYYLALPLLLLSICLCLPCVLCFMSRFAASDAGAESSDIEALRTIRFDPAEYARDVEARRQLRLQQRSSAVGATSAAVASAAVPQTATEAVSSSTDEHKVSAVPSSDADAPTCAICCQPYEQDEELRILPCDHDFHTNCIDHWLRIRPTCPICRGSIIGSNHGDDSPHRSPPPAPRRVVPSYQSYQNLAGSINVGSESQPLSQRQERSVRDEPEEEPEDADTTRLLPGGGSSSDRSDVRIEMSALSSQRQSSEAPGSTSSSGYVLGGDQDSEEAALPQNHLSSVLYTRGANLANRQGGARNGGESEQRRSSGTSPR